MTKPSPRAAPEEGKMAEQVGVIPLTFLMYPCPEDEDKYVAHCLEMDIVSVGDTVPAAIDLLKELIEDVVLAALEDGALSEVIRPAPLRYWRRLATAIPYEPPRRVVKHRIAAQPIRDVNYALAPA